MFISVSIYVFNLLFQNNTVDICKRARGVNEKCTDLIEGMETST